MASWLLLIEPFYWFIYIEIITHTYQNSMKWAKTITTAFKTKFCFVSREHFVNMTKLHLLTNLHHHTLYHVSGVVVRWRRTVLRRRRTSHTILRYRRTQVLPWRASTYVVVCRRRTRSIGRGVWNDHFLSHDNLGQHRTGPTTAYVDVRRRRTLRESWIKSYGFWTCSETSYDNLRLDISPASTCVDVRRRRTRSRLPVVDLS